MKVFLTEKAKKQLKKFIPEVQDCLLEKFDEIESLDNPRLDGKPLKGRLKGYWAYKVKHKSTGYRIITIIYDNLCVIAVVEIGDRKEIYKNLTQFKKTEKEVLNSVKRIKR